MGAASDRLGDSWRLYCHRTSLYCEVVHPCWPTDIGQYSGRRVLFLWLPFGSTVGALRRSIGVVVRDLIAMMKELHEPEAAAADVSIRPRLSVDVVLTSSQTPNLVHAPSVWHHFLPFVSIL